MASRRNCARLAVSQKPSSSQARLRPTKPGLLTVGWRKFEFPTRVPADAAFRKNGPLVNAPFTAFILRPREPGEWGGQRENISGHKCFARVAGLAAACVGLPGGEDANTAPLRRSKR